MQFKSVPVAKAKGWTLAHSIAVGANRIAKNSKVTADIIARLQEANIEAIQAYRLETCDIDENTAAGAIANHIQGTGVKAAIAFNGRCNLHACSAGLLLVEDKIDDLNAAAPSVGIATLHKYTPVQQGQLVATVKIIPFGIEQNQLKAVLKIDASLKIKAYRPFTVALLSTGAPITAKTAKVTKNRLESVLGSLKIMDTCRHDVNSVTDKIREIATNGPDLLIVSGPSAISDHRDILPSAVKKAGGDVLHLGMPVDPGNLLMLGKLNAMTVIGMPGCAKSPSLNGFDWVLERYAAGLPLDAGTLQKMGIGGLLKEPVGRPEPRAPVTANAPTITAAIVLAAGKSSRSGDTHKLLALLDSKPVIEQSIIALRKAGLEQIHLVTGARAAEIETALDSQRIHFTHNADYDFGMGTSLAAGISSLPDSTEQCLISLGDMPFVQPSTIQTLQNAAVQISEADIFVPLFKGKRGNPVLWRKNQFEKLKQIKGDQGGRSIMRSQENLVCEVPVDDPGVLIDLDTPEALAQFGISVTS